MQTELSPAAIGAAVVSAAAHAAPWVAISKEPSIESNMASSSLGTGDEDALTEGAMTCIQKDCADEICIADH